MSNPWEIQTIEYDKTNAEGNAEVSGYKALTQSNSFGVSSVGSEKLRSVEITYYNDTEIT